jgi:hypothetical protein
MESGRSARLAWMPPPPPDALRRHLELFEVVVLDALLELAEEEVVGDQVLLGEAGGIDGLDAARSARSRWWRAAEAARE